MTGCGIFEIESDIVSRFMWRPFAVKKEGTAKGRSFQIQLVGEGQLLRRTSSKYRDIKVFFCIHA